MDNRLNLIERIKMLLNGYLYVGHEKLEGWKEPVPFYVFKCPKHGYVKTYRMGYNESLICPECLKESKDKLNGNFEVQKEQDNQVSI